MMSPAVYRPVSGRWLCQTLQSCHISQRVYG